jgi:hypothetical protein
LKAEKSDIGMLAAFGYLGARLPPTPSRYQERRRVRMKKRLVAAVLGVCSFLVLAAPTAVATGEPPPPGQLPITLCLDLVGFRLFCP